MPSHAHRRGDAPYAVPIPPIDGVDGVGASVAHAIVSDHLPASSGRMLPGPLNQGHAVALHLEAVEIPPGRRATLHQGEITPRRFFRCDAPQNAWRGLANRCLRGIAPRFPPRRAARYRARQGTASSTQAGTSNDARPTLSLIHIFTMTRSESRSGCVLIQSSKAPMSL